MIVLMLGEPGEDEEQDERRRDGEERERDRDRGRNERAKDEEQHDERGEEAEELLRPLLDRRELGVAVELGGNACGLDPFTHGVLDRDHLGPVLRLDDAVELRLRVGDPPVVGERVCLENGSPTLSSPTLSPLGANSEVLSCAIASSIAALRSGVSSRSPSGAAKTRLSTQPCSDANSDSMRSVAFCVSEPGISNSSFRLPPTVATSTISPASDREPGDDDAPGVVRAGAHPTRECAGRKSFVRCEAFCLGFVCLLRHAPPSASSRFP